MSQYASPIGVCLLVLLLASNVVYSQNSPENADDSGSWELVWADEFERDGRPTPAKWNDEIGYNEWPFDQPFHLILHLAVGGTWGGQEGIDPSIWPQRLEVDYVRVYKHRN